MRDASSLGTHRRAHAALTAHAGWRCRGAPAPGPLPVPPVGVARPCMDRAPHRGERPRPNAPPSRRPGSPFLCLWHQARVRRWPCWRPRCWRDCHNAFAVSRARFWRPDVVGFSFYSFWRLSRQCLAPLPPAPACRRGLVKGEDGLPTGPSRRRRLFFLKTGLSTPAPAPWRLAAQGAGTKEAAFVAWSAARFGCSRPRPGTRLWHRRGRPRERGHPASRQSFDQAACQGMAGRSLASRVPRPAPAWAPRPR